MDSLPHFVCACGMWNGTEMKRATCRGCGALAPTAEGVSRTLLLGTLKCLLVEYSAMAENLEKTQGRCTELLKRVRELEIGKDGDVERVAEAIYRHNVCAPEDYEVECGKPVLEWKTGAPWDTNPRELTEHERDDYRRVARAAIEAMKLR